MAPTREKRIAEFVQSFRVAPGKKVTLAKDFDPGFKTTVESKKQGQEMLANGIDMLAEYQSRLYAQDTHGVLVVLQALDAAARQRRHLCSRPDALFVEIVRPVGGQRRRRRAVDEGAT